MLKASFPDFEWLEWKLEKTPNGFWWKKENRRRCLDWLGGRLGFEEPEDWYQLSRRDFAEHRCSSLLNYYQRYLDWLGEELGLEAPRDWLGLRRADFQDNYGFTLFAMYRYSVRDVLLDTFPKSHPISKAARAAR